MNHISKNKNTLHFSPSPPQKKENPQYFGLNVTAEEKMYFYKTRKTGFLANLPLDVKNVLLTCEALTATNFHPKLA